MRWRCVLRISAVDPSAGACAGVGAGADLVGPGVRLPAVMSGLREWCSWRSARGPAPFRMRVRRCFAVLVRMRLRLSFGELVWEQLVVGV